MTGIGGVRPRVLGYGGPSSSSHGSGSPHGPTVAGAGERGPPLAPLAPAPPGAAGGPSPFARLLHGLGAAVDDGEALTRRALGSLATAQGTRPVAPVDLLALQAGLCRYSEAVDLASRVVDRATGSIKTVLQGQ